MASKVRQSRAADCCEPKAVDSIDIFAVVMEAEAVAADAQLVLETCLFSAEKVLPVKTNKNDDKKLAKRERQQMHSVCDDVCM